MGHVKLGGSAGAKLSRIRPARLPHDADAIAALDISFDTDVIFTPRLGDGQISLEEVRLDAPTHQVLPAE